MTSDPTSSTSVSQPESQAAEPHATATSPADAAGQPQPGLPPDQDAAAAARRSTATQGLKIGSQRPEGQRGKARSPQFEQAKPIKKSPVPNIRDQLPPELELEVAAAFGSLSLDEALKPVGIVGDEIETDARRQGRVALIHQEEVFVDLGGRNQGIMSLQQFATPPEVGQNIEVVVRGMDPEDGLYRLSLPGGTIDVGDWSEIREGELVEARVTGHNKGGLECELSGLRGFMPASQISDYRVEDLAQFVGQKMVCLITEANPSKRNLLLSRRAVLEREKAEAREQLLNELAEGQVREGTVRSLRDFGAFIDLGGVDGLLHVSQLGWHRVKHPSEVLTVGQTIKVLVRKIDPDSKKISLSFRDLTESPWTHVTTRYPVTSHVRGKVTKVMDFGAFVELEPGIEGMVHISEISHTRVFRIRDFVKEGDEVEVKVLSIDTEAQRLGLSIKAALARAEPALKAEPESPEEDATPVAPAPARAKTPLKGGVQRPASGDKFGLKW